MSPACCSCSSCTVHSTSASPPWPSLVCVARSAPRGSRSASTRALIRRISVTAAGAQAVGRVADRVDELDEAAAEVHVARDRAGPQQRLRLPRLRPAGVVLAVRRQRADQRAGPALRPQVGVDRPAPDPGSRCRAGGGRSRPRSSRTSRPRGPRRRRGARRRTARRRRCRSPARRRRACPCRSRRAGPGGAAPPSARNADASTALQHRGPHRRQPAADLLDVQHAEQVRARDPQHLVPPGRAGGRRGGVRVGLAADGRAQRRRGVGRVPDQLVGADPAGAASSRSTSGARTSRSGTSADVPSSRMSRSATSPSSRSSRRYQGVVASASDTRR